MSDIPAFFSVDLRVKVISMALRASDGWRLSLRLPGHPQAQAELKVTAHGCIRASEGCADKKLTFGAIVGHIRAKDHAEP